MTIGKQLLVLTVASVLLGLGARVVQEKPVPFWGWPEPIKTIQPPMALAESIASIDEAFPAAQQPYEVDYATVSQLWMKRTKQNIHFIDARDPKLYSEGHIPGSQNIPFERIGSFQDQLDQLPKSDLAVLYCDGGDCHLSHDLAEHMLGLGWQRIAIYSGGWADWSAETDAVETAQ